MKIKDVMTTDVCSVPVDAGVGEIARLLVEKRISAVPVVGDDGRVLGVVSEGDLLRRMEAEAEENRSWWMSLVADADDLKEPVVKFRGLVARDVMTTPAVTVDEESDLGEVADILSRKRIKRLPVLRGGERVGIVSRTDVLAALAGVTSRGA